MSYLIKRFKEDLPLAGYAKRSTESYVSWDLRLQRFYNKPLEDITEEDLRQYWLCCQSEFGWSTAPSLIWHPALFPVLFTIQDVSPIPSYYSYCAKTSSSQSKST